MVKRPRGKKQRPTKNVTVKTSQEAVKEATGTEQPQVQIRLINQALESLWLPENLGDEERVARHESAISMLQGIGPTGEVEGLLAAQMVATHNAAMECLRRAMIPEQSFHGRDQNLKHAAKLLSIYTRQIDVLDKHRGKGQQKVTVEYVNIESGGQAVVGHVESGRAAAWHKKGNQPEPRAIPNEPDMPIDLDADFDRATPGKKS